MILPVCDAVGRSFKIVTFSMTETRALEEMESGKSEEGNGVTRAYNNTLPDTSFCPIVSYAGVNHSAYGSCRHFLTSSRLDGRL